MWQRRRSVDWAPATMVELGKRVKGPTQAPRAVGDRINTAYRRRRVKNVGYQEVARSGQGRSVESDRAAEQADRGGVAPAQGGYFRRRSADRGWSWIVAGAQARERAARGTPLPDSGGDGPAEREFLQRSDADEGADADADSQRRKSAS